MKIKHFCLLLIVPFFCLAEGPSKEQALVDHIVELELKIEALESQVIKLQNEKRYQDSAKSFKEVDLVKPQALAVEVGCDCSEEIVEKDKEILVLQNRIKTLSIKPKVVKKTAPKKYTALDVSKNKLRQGFFSLQKRINRRKQLYQKYVRKQEPRVKINLSSLKTREGITADNFQAKLIKVKKFSDLKKFQTAIDRFKKLVEADISLFTRLLKFP